MTVPSAASDASPPLAESPSLVLEMIEVTVPRLNDANATVLEGVNWRVARGDFWAVGGLHFSGKTDFVLLTAGLMPPKAGKYRVFGRDLALEQSILPLRLRLGLVFDGGQLFHQLSVAENIALPLRYHHGLSEGEIRARTEGLLELTELTADANKWPDQIGRNRRQRAGLARALSLDPEVLVLDSPLSGLDPVDHAWWLETLTHLARGHSALQSKPLTLVVTADDLRPWQGRARQFAALQDRRFIPLESDATLRARWFGETTMEPA